jgi:hypothetical protein
MVGAMLALLGFILAITFGTQLQRFDTGKQLLRSEASAIHQTWLLADMMPARYRDEARGILRDYVDVRADNRGDLSERIGRSERMQSALWRICLAGVAEMEEHYPRELLLESLNQLISLHEQRVAVSVREHMPVVFWIVLFALAILTFGLAGYQAGMAGSPRNAARPIAVVGFALLVLLIADLDRPGHGGLRFDQYALEYVAMRMDTHGQWDRQAVAEPDGLDRSTISTPE